MPTVEVPHVPGSVNQWSRAHWAVRAAEAKRWRDLFAVYGACAPRLVGPVRVVLTFYWPDRRRHDAANAEKLVMDGAVALGLIEDDGPPLLVELVLRSRYDPARPRVSFEYEQADAPAWDSGGVRTQAPRAKRAARGS